ncbi:MAG: M20/M25/M40 family metallo-hydrolase, partial [Oscillospiraceae bacterium]|nr:M20/M25/M40 family metallo-hydrolase [Oscillospiraceae bacterium]
MSELEKLLIALCRIPAPSGSEQARADFICSWFREQGCAAFCDEAGNVLLPLGARDGDLAIIAAHTDTVFSDTEPLQPECRGTRLYCPGAGDDTANLAILMLAARDLCRSGKMPKIGILFAADVCEEGLGNLAGCRALMARYGARTREFVSFDLYRDRVYSRAVGSARYRITLRCKGGHSFGDFGSKSAIHAAAELVCALYAQTAPQGGKVTWNVGTVEGGT